jgi:hypothetical protein
LKDVDLRLLASQALFSIEQEIAKFGVASFEKCTGLTDG